MHQRNHSHSALCHAITWRPWWQGKTSALNLQRTTDMDGYSVKSECNPVIAQAVARRLIPTLRKSLREWPGGTGTMPKTSHQKTEDAMNPPRMKRRKESWDFGVNQTLFRPGHGARAKNPDYKRGGNEIPMWFQAILRRNDFMRRGEILSTEVRPNQVGR